MLQQMRNFSKSIVSSIFLGALALSFVVWGVADIFRGSTDDTVFKVGSNKVNVAMFTRDFHNAVRNQRTALTPDQTKAIGKEVLDRMMLATALDNMTASLGLTASDARVGQQIHAISAFNGPLGGFDHDVFLRAINQAGYTEKEFVEVSRKDVARGQMLRGVEGGFQMPADYARAIFSYVNEVRAAEYVVVTPASLGEVPPPNDAVLAAYVKAHPERFSTPEYRTVSYVAINAEDLAPGIAVTDKQIQAEIDGNKAAYIVPERRTLEQIQFPSEADAKAAKAALDGGKSFDALATERKLKPADYKIGDVVADDLDKARAAAFFALPDGGISAPVKSTFGWVLMHVAKITPGSAKSHDEVKAILQRKIAVDKMTDISNAYGEAVNDGLSMADAARKSGMHFVHLAAVDEQGLAPDGSKVLTPANPELLAAIFKAEAGDEGDPFPTQDSLHYFAIKVEGITPPKPKPLDAVRALATARWLAEKKVELLRAKAVALTAQANAQHSLKAVAAALGAPVQSSPALNRGTSDMVLNALVVRALYDAPAGKAIFAPTMDGNFVIARVSGIGHPLPPEENLGYQRGVYQLGGEIASDITIALAQAVQQRDGKKVNQALVDSTVGNSGSGS
ncbi:MAG: peptidyl-prolyl cis-trans isomerase [Rhizomicrobium sp.]